MKMGSGAQVERYALKNDRGMTRKREKSEKVRTLLDGFP